VTSFVPLRVPEPICWARTEPFLLSGEQCCSKSLRCCVHELGVVSPYLPHCSVLDCVGVYTRSQATNQASTRYAYSPRAGQGERASRNSIRILYPQPGHFPLLPYTVHGSLDQNESNIALRMQSKRKLPSSVPFGSRPCTFLKWHSSRWKLVIIWSPSCATLYLFGRQTCLHHQTLPQLDPPLNHARGSYPAGTAPHKSRATGLDMGSIFLACGQNLRRRCPSTLLVADLGFELGDKH
jgi:hypothetical protein